MTTPDRALDPPMHLEIGDDVVPFCDPETGEPGTRRVWLLAARAEGSDRFWPDFVHRHVFDSRAQAERVRDRVVSLWGDTPPARNFRNAHWRPDGRPDPLAALTPFGEEWQREQDERAGR